MRLKPSTEELLYFLLWTAEAFIRPTRATFNDSFEAWAWRNGNGPYLAELRRQHFVQGPGPDAEAAVVRLTRAGRRAALGGRDPVEQWNRPWDGRWRMVVFDVPVHQNTVRVRLLRFLHEQGYGFLQNSVWITPDAIDTHGLTKTAGTPEVEAMILLEARACGGETDGSIVQGGWDFSRINGRHQACLNLLAHPPRNGARLRSWARQERRLWRTAMHADPLLPRPLLPRDYLGMKVWDTRSRVLTQLAASPA